MMKRVISFAVLFLVGISNSYGDCKDGLSIGQYDWACNLDDPADWQNGSQNKQYVDPGIEIQTVGQATWYCIDSWFSSTNITQAGNNSRYKCTDATGGNDVWSHMAGREAYCNNSPIRTKNVTNGYFELYKSDGTYSGFNSNNPGATVRGCLRVSCQQGYTPIDPDCQKVDQVAKCEPKDTTHPNMGACHQDAGGHCLMVASNEYLYCYSKDEYAYNTIHDLGNSCQYNKQRVVINDVPDSYFSCADDGKWKKTNLTRCDSQYDKFTNGCAGVDNCVTKIKDLSGNSPADFNKKYEVFTGSVNKFCAYSVCEDGYTQANGKCVSNAIAAKATKCAGSFGDWDPQNNKCTCDPNKNLKLVGDKCECKNAQYTRDNTKRNCFYNAEALKAACIDSMGTWQEGAGNDLDTCVCDPAKEIEYDDQQQKCVCIDPDKEIKTQNGVATGCDLTEEAQKKKNCNDSNVAKWEGGKCVCNENTKIWDDTNNKCIDNPDYTKCNAITGAEWDGDERKCKCKDSGQEINSDKTACVDTEATKAKKKMAASDTVINETFDAFEGEIKNLKVDKWKNQDGKFNVARLASDSIAGVVLGTVGGLVTSKVVKKNQVKKGFENIRCVIGGQIVADYGDEFMVGSK